MKIILYTLLLLFSTNGLSANWKKFGESKNGSTFYVDVENIKIRKEHIHYLLLIDYSELTKIGTYSDISEYKVDCVNEKQTWLSNKIFSKPMAQGKIITKEIPVWNHYGSTINETRYLEPGSIEQHILLEVCSTVR